MCGRFTLTTDINPLQAYFPVTVPNGLGPLTPRYNIAPTESSGPSAGHRST